MNKVLSSLPALLAAKGLHVGNDNNPDPRLSDTS